MLYNLSLKNIKRSFKDYAIYFFTLILGVAIFYVFNAIESQTVLLKVTSSTESIIELMTTVLSSVSVFVSFILGFLIIYASQFLIKRRNKEFGVYMTLGMSKRKISTLLFWETLMIGFISLIVGLGLGIILSQLMSLLVANMFEADMTEFTFVFSQSACGKTMIYFGIIYLIVMIFNVININRCQLIDLLYAYRKNEQIKLKNPILCIIVFIVACSALGYAYWQVTAGIHTLTSVNKIIIPIILGSLSTFLIFWSVSGLILKILMSFKGLYYKGLNSFTLRQFASKINTTVFSMTVICLMLFVTICLLSSALTIKNSMIMDIDELAPADIQISGLMNLNDQDILQGNYKETTVQGSWLPLEERLNRLGVDYLSYLKEYERFHIYRDYHLTLKESLGSQYENIHNQFPMIFYDSNEDIMTISEYNKVAKFYGKPVYHLQDDEYMVIADYDSMAQLRNIALKSHEKIKVFNTVLKPKYTECKDGFVEMSGSHITEGIILVPDQIVTNEDIHYESIVGNYKTKDKEEILGIEKRIKNALSDSESREAYAWPSINSRLDIIEASIGLGAMVTFIGLYLGVIFLISSAAILALKELSESVDNKKRFDMIRKLGADERIVNKALFREIGIFFLFPLALAIIHSIFGMKFSIFILEIFGTRELYRSIFMTSIFIVVIYGGYFLLTYICSKNMIRER